MLNRANEGCRARSSGLIRTSGIAVGLSGLGLAGTGLWARREVRRMLARERVVSGSDSTPTNAQAYVSSRLADLMVGLGAVFVAAGTGIAAAASRR